MNAKINRLSIWSRVNVQVALEDREFRLVLSNKTNPTKKAPKPEIHPFFGHDIDLYAQFKEQKPRPCDIAACPAHITLFSARHFVCEKLFQSFESPKSCIQSEPFPLSRLDESFGEPRPSALQTKRLECPSSLHSFDTLMRRPSRPLNTTYLYH